MGDTSLLIAQGLGHTAPNGSPLIQDVSFELEPGAVLAIAGPNGAGKTTLLNLLCGVEPVKRGDILLAGRSLSSYSSMQRARQIATVSQHESPDGRLLLRDYVALGQIPILADQSHQDHQRDLDRVLALTGLLPLANNSMARLSGGERQRAHIARALTQKPSLLFLDEPTNHLDPDAKGRVLSLVADLGITSVMVLHDLVMIPTFATHIALLKASRLMAFGPVDQVLTPQNVRDVFGVDYLCLSHKNRIIPALDIRKSNISTQKEIL
ncbi:iron ABC transporter [Amylibacter marinus]|uniref:Iron ABC transporter n=2 Tax=Amylibacter marinus TaxID=1475483 RepID=A0ABQ5VUQ3_9RHOB|nr:iron ABC transporter [Amylibacter marinus]